jgi:peptidoglycan hydrolase CwlO-like protein
MRKTVWALLALIILLVIPVIFAQTTDDTLPATVIQQISQKVDAVNERQNTIIASINDLKIQIHDDLNVFVTKEQFEEYKTLLNKKIDSKPDLSTMIFAIIVGGGLFFVLFLIFKGKGQI